MTAAARKQEVATVTETPVVSHSAGLIAVIERAATNPDVDIDKMERLLEMHERIVAREGRMAYFGAMAAMQPDLPVIGRRGTISVPAKDGKTGHETPYALWEDVNEAIRPLLAQHGFALSFRVKKDADRVEVTGILSHRSGHAEETMLSLPMDSTGSKNNVQAIGSSVSYGKRYTAFALLNITSRGEDDDGQKGGTAAVLSDEQADRIRKLIGEVKADAVLFLEYIGAPSVSDIPAVKFNSAVAALESKRGKAK